MYNDRIEIINPGTLYGANKLEKIDLSTNFEVRNPTIIRILEEKCPVVENRHSGIPTMKREMKKYDLPEPEFYEGRDFFKVIFRNRLTEQDVYYDYQCCKQASGSKTQKSGAQVQKSGAQIQKSGAQVQKSGAQIQKSGAQMQIGGAQIQKSGAQIQESGAQNYKLDIILNNVLSYCVVAKSAEEIRIYLNINSKRYVAEKIIKPLINNGKLDYTNKNVRNAKNQKYITKK